MGIFTCCVCNAAFHIPDETVARYRRWQPKYCQNHAFVGMMRSRPFGKSPTDAADRLTRRSAAYARRA